MKYLHKQLDEEKPKSFVPLSPETLKFIALLNENARKNPNASSAYSDADDPEFVLKHEPKPVSKPKVFRKEIPPEPKFEEPAPTPKKFNMSLTKVAILLVFVVFVGYEIGMWILANLKAIETGLTVIGFLALIIWLKLSPEKKSKK